jgi:cobalamin biosynthesis protein CobT
VISGEELKEESEEESQQEETGKEEEEEEVKTDSEEEKDQEKERREKRAEEKETEEERAEKYDKHAWEEMEEEGAVVDEKEENKEEEQLGGKLMKEEYVNECEKIHYSHLVENGSAAEWINSPPPTPRRYTRRLRYSGEMHVAMLKAINDEIRRGVIRVIPAAQARYVLPAFVVIRGEKKRDWLHLIDNIRPH